MTSSSEQPKEQQQREGKAYYHSDITPEVLENIQIGDWIRGIGDISCPFDQRVVQTVGTWLRMHDTRSRPHPAPGTLQKAYEVAFDEGFEIGKAQCETHHQEMRAAIARKAREDVLKLLEEWDYINNRNFGKPHPVFADMIRLVREKPDEVRKHLESLRSTTPQSEQGGSN